MKKLTPGRRVTAKRREGPRGGALENLVPIRWLISHYMEPKGG